MSEFLNNVLQEARRVSNNILNKIDELVNDDEITTQEDSTDLITNYRELQRLYFELQEENVDLERANAELGDEVLDLIDRNDDLRIALLLLLDGETSKSFTPTQPLLLTLSQYTIEVFWDTPSTVKIQVNRD